MPEIKIIIPNVYCYISVQIASYLSKNTAYYQKQLAASHCSTE